MLNRPIHYRLPKCIIDDGSDRQSRPHSGSIGAGSRPTDSIDAVTAGSKPASLGGTIANALLSVSVLVLLILSHMLVPVQSED